MQVDFEIDTVKVLTEEIRKSLTGNIDTAAIAVKLALIQNEIVNTTSTQRLFNKYAVSDE